ncbi:MAG: PDZ domain-containing protein [Pseudomonadota bacterium]|nr:PDZ domain-containing protein [Pseudomonadota bacterium]
MSQAFDLIYRVHPASPQAHLFAVELTIPLPPAEELILSLPAWIPGSYMIRDFARNIIRIEAADASGSRTLEKLDKQTWRLRGIQAPVTVRYQVYAWELTVRAAHLDGTHAYFNGPSLFLRAQGLDRVPCRVELERPAGDEYGDWRIATSLRRLDAEPFGFGAYQADDYEDLIDHPVEMGTFTLIPFMVRGIPHQMAITGRHRADEARLQRDLTRICEQHVTLFGDLPIDRYLFLTTAVGEGYGGLEHCYSSSLLCSRDELPKVGEEKPSEGYRRFLGLCSHEYFHLWNVKRIRPRVFTDKGLGQEVHTRLLWAFEGITSYCDELALVRSGCIEQRDYLQLLAETITRVMRNPGRLLQTVAESSFDAWTKFYKQDENAPNAIVSYYAKGALVALALDLTIRRETEGAKSLDDLMRALWERHGKSAVGVSEGGVEVLAAEVTGLDLDAFFRQALDSTEDLELTDLLAAQGIGLRMRPARGSKDLGGVADEVKDEPAKPTLGIRLQPNAADAVIGVVLTGSAAQRAGLAPGDTLIALDGIRVSRENLDTLVEGIPEGAETSIHAFRRDELMGFRVRPVPAAADTCELRILPDATEEAAQRRAAWLGSAG